MPNYLKALTPFFNQTQDLYAEQRRQGQLNAEQARRDEQIAYERKKYEENLARELEQQKIDRALKVLTGTGEVPAEAAKILQSGGLGGMVQDTSESLKPSVGPWGTAQIDTGGQAPRYLRRKSPDEVEEDEIKRQNALLAQQYREAQTAELRRKSEAPKMIAELIQRNGGNFNLESMAPALAMGANDPVSVIKAIMAEKRAQAGQKRADAQLGLSQRRLNIMEELARNRDIRAAGKANAVPVAQQRFDQQRQNYAALMTALMSDIDENVAEYDTPQDYMEAVRDDPDWQHGESARAMFLAELQKKYGR